MADEQSGETSKSDETLKQDDVKKDTKNEKQINPRSDIDLILDVIGGIKFAVASQRIETRESDDFIKAISADCDLVLTKGTTVPINYNVWIDRNNFNVYIITKPIYDCTFTDCDSFVNNRLSVREKIIDDSTKILVEPSSRVIDGIRVYEPINVGIDYDAMFQINLDNAQQQLIRQFCQRFDNRGTFGRVRTRTDRRIANTRQAIFDYFDVEMNILIEQVDEYIDICSMICNEPFVARRVLANAERPHPFCSPFLTSGVFDGFARASRLRYEYSASTFAPEVRLNPADLTTMMRVVKSNVTTVSFVTEIIQLAYKPAWARPISWYMSSWLSLGDLLLEFDDSDIPRDAGVKNVVASLLFLSSVVYDSRSVYSNTTISSIRRACKKILDWCRSRNILVDGPQAAEDAGHLTALSNAVVRPDYRRALENEHVRVIGGVDGIAGASTRSALPILEEPLARFFPGISHRRNVAINCDDYEIWKNMDCKPEWPLENAINALIACHPELRGFGPLVQTFLERQKDFYVRLNEYMRISHYNIFTRSENNRQRHDGDQTDSLVVEIQSMIFVYMAKSWPTDFRFSQKYDATERMRVQSGFFKGLIDVGQRWRLINQAYASWNALTEISRSKRLELACSKYSYLEYIFELLKALGSEGQLIQLIDDEIFINNGFANIFRNIDVLTDDALLRDGIIPRFQVRYQLNRIDEAMIRGTFQDGGYLHNFLDLNDRILIDYTDIRRAFTNRYFKAMIFGANDLSYDFRLMVPYVVVHEIPKVDDKILLNSKNIEGPDLTLRKCLEVSPLKIFMVQTDVRNYASADSFVTTPIILENAYPATNFMNNVIITRDEFIGQMYVNSVIERCIVADDFSFVSILSQNMIK